MEGPRLTIVVILLLFIFFSPDQPIVRYHDPGEQTRLAIEKWEDFNALANSSYGDLPSTGLNLTGCRPGDGYQWQLLPVAQDLSRHQQIDSWYEVPRQTPVYRIIDGDVRGDFNLVDSQKDYSRSLNLTQLDPASDYLTTTFDRNVSDSHGQLTIELELKGEPSRFVAGEVKAAVSIITDSSPGNGWEAKMRGVHFPSGFIILTTSSAKFNALSALPHFTRSEEEFMRSKMVMNSTLTQIWKGIDHGQVDLNPVFTAPKCELIIWMQQKPLSGNNVYISGIEEELRHPDGAPIGPPPPLVYSAVVLSPDCGYILQADTIFGPKAELYSMLVRRIVAAFCLVLIGQIILLKRQMEKCATPSTRSRVSYHTFGIAAFGDGLILFAIIGLLIVDVSVYLLAGAAAFLCCIHVAFLEVKFIFDIWTVQVGDPANAERDRQTRAATTNTTSTTTGPGATSNIQQPELDTSTDSANPIATSVSTIPTPPRASSAGLPLPATAPSQSPTTILPPDQDLTATTLTDIPPRISFASLYTRFYFALMNLTFLTLWASSWPPVLRHAYFNLLSFLFLSLYLPQIHRNILRNCRKALSWEYLIGSSILRTIPVLYWYLVPRNILHTNPSPRTAFFLLMWLAAQLIILASQQLLGARWFVKDAWCPPAYDYHPVLYDDLEAGGLPIGEITSASEGKDADPKRLKTAPGDVRKIFDCAICMNEIDVPVVSKEERKKNSAGLGSGSVGRSTSTWLEQRNYMVTPCRHIFHSECLEGWMNLRLVCPVCREGLPPL